MTVSWTQSVLNRRKGNTFYVECMFKRTNRKRLGKHKENFFSLEKKYNQKITLTKWEIHELTNIVRHTILANPNPYDNAVENKLNTVFNPISR